MDVIPGIGEIDPKELARKIALVLPYTDWIQLDIADDTLVASKTFSDSTALERILTPMQALGKHAEAHLLVADPVPLVKAVSQAGFSRVTAHVECEDPREFLAEARSFEMEVGMAIGADTEIEVIEPYLEELDYILVMTGELDSTKHIFQPETVEKIKTIHRNLPDLPIVAEVGITPETIKLVADAGVSRVVVGSYLFGNEQDIVSRIEELQTA
jgi:ribulose-phosphate 3-epimerase